MDQTLAEWNLKNGRKLTPVELDAGYYLEHHGQILGLNFNPTNVVDRAAKLLCDLLREDWFPEEYNGWS